MSYSLYRGIRGSVFLGSTIFTLLWTISCPSFAEILDDTLSLVETKYNPSIYALEGNSTITSYTLSSFLADVVTKSGTFAINATEEDQNFQHYKTGFSWDSGDENTFLSWEPLAVATWQDSIMGEVSESTISAVDDVVKGTVVVSWKDTAKDNNGGLRVTFVTNGTVPNIQRRYKHVLLVENPTAKTGGGFEFTLVNSTSIGGLVWYRNWLYVGDGNKGLRVFDLMHIWKVDSKTGRGMEYAVPQVRSYNVTNFPAMWQTFTFDFLSLDRSSTPPCLLAGEYEEGDTAMTYLARWQFDPGTGGLKTVQTGGKSIATSVWAYRITVLRARGIIFAHDAYYIGRLRTLDGTSVGDMNERAGLYIWEPGTLVDPIEQVLPKGAGGMAYSPNGDLMWAVGTAQGARGVVGILAGGFLESQTSSPPGPNFTGASLGNLGDSPSSSASSPNFTGAPLGNSGDSPSSSDSSQPPAGAIAGGVLGGLLILALLAVLVLYWRRRRQADVAKEAQYPGFVEGDELYKGEIPTHKSELDASVNGPAAATSQQSVEDSAKCNKKARLIMPKRKPVPTEVGGGLPGQESWAELEAVEKPAELSSK